MFQVSMSDSELVLSGEFDRGQTIEARTQLEEYVRSSSAAAMSLNLENLTTFNSEVLSLCLCLLRTAKQCGVELNFVNAPSRLFDMARVGGMEFIFSH